MTWTPPTFPQEEDGPENPDTGLPPGWEFTDLGDLVCPCGDQIELDGECGEEHVSPLRQAGLI